MNDRREEKWIQVQMLNARLKTMTRPEGLAFVRQVNQEHQEIAREYEPVLGLARRD